MKKKSKPRDTIKSAPGLVSVRLQLTPADHHRLRAAAGAAGKPMAIFVRELVLAALAKPR